MISEPTTIESGTGRDLTLNTHTKGNQWKSLMGRRDWTEGSTRICTVMQVKPREGRHGKAKEDIRKQAEFWLLRRELEADFCLWERFT